jgi:hypothetical protein
MIKHLRILILTVLLALLMVGCSGNSPNPVVPSGNGGDLEEITSDRQLLGTWQITLDVNSLTATVNPVRDADMHWNVTPYVTPVFCSINSYNQETHVADVDVTITNPSQYGIDAYDVRLIMMTDEIGHGMYDPDDWTELYDDSGIGYAMNPFKAYNKSLPQREFLSGEESTENILISCPNNNYQITIKIDASFPGNCDEPYEISNFQQEELLTDVGSTALIQVDVYDWQDDIDSVKLFCPAFSGSPYDFTFDSGNTWTLILGNTTGLPSGNYPAMIRATSSGSGYLELIDFVSDGIAIEAKIWNTELVDSNGAHWFSNPNMDVDSSGRPHICYKDITDSTLKYAIKKGESWDLITSAVSVYRFDGMELDSNDKPHVLFGAPDIYPEGTGISYAYYNGEDWVNVVELYTPWPGTQSSIAVDSSDDAHVAIHGGGGPQGVLHYWQTLGVWNPPDHPIHGDQLIAPSIDLDSGDYPAIAYHQMYSCDLWVKRKGISGWEPEYLISSSGYIPVLRFGDSDTIHVIYQDGTCAAGYRNICYSYYNGTYWSSCKIEDPRNLRFPSLAVDSNNIAHICYISGSTANPSSGEELYYSHSLGTNTAELAEPVLVQDTVNVAPSGCSIAILPGNDPVIAYIDDTNDDLRYAF